MPLSTIRLHPGMSYAALIAALNENFALVENINRTLIMKDEKGTSRILIGQGPDKKYVIAVTKPNIDVVKALSK